MDKMCTAMEEYEIEIAQKAMDDFAGLLRTLRKSGRKDDFERAINDQEYREKLLEEYCKSKVAAGLPV